MIQNIKKDDERIKEIIGITFVSVFLTIPMRDSTMPVPVSKNVILSPTEFPIFAILVGVINTIKKQIMPLTKEI